MICINKRVYLPQDWFSPLIWLIFIVFHNQYKNDDDDDEDNNTLFNAGGDNSY